MDTNNNPLAWLVLSLCVTSSMTEVCVPGHNCIAPACRCWNDPSPPGGIAPLDTPQIVVMTFNYALNTGNVDKYDQLMAGIANPNNCPARATFFVQELYSSVSSIERIYSNGHEIGVTSSNGTLPSDWDASFKEVKNFLTTKVGIPAFGIIGARAPQLTPGGDKQMAAQTNNRLTYDSSCVSRPYSNPTTMLWPYTYDFVENSPRCESGRAPSKDHPGVWEFLLPEFKFRGHLCATPYACTPFMNNSKAHDTYEFFTTNFLQHFNYKRTPFFVNVDPGWMSEAAHVEGTKWFLQYIRAAYKDTVWILTNRQVLDWMKSPVPVDKAKEFAPWGC